MTTASIPGTGPENAGFQLKELSETIAKGIGGYQTMSPHAAIMASKKDSSEELDPAAAKKIKESAEESKNLMRRLMEMFKRWILGIMQGFRETFGDKSKLEKKDDKKEQEQGSKRGESQKGQSPFKAANNDQTPKPAANDGAIKPTMTGPMKNFAAAAANTAPANDMPANDQPANDEQVSASTAMGLAKGAAPVLGAAGLTAMAMAPSANEDRAVDPTVAAISNGWVVEDGERATGAYNGRMLDVEDIDVREVDDEPIKASNPTVLLSGSVSQADMIANAIKAMNETVSRQMQNPDVIAKIKEASQIDDERAFQETVTELLIGPSLADAEQQGDALRQSLAEQIMEALKSESMDDSLAEVTAQAVVESLPANLATQMLSPEHADKITEMLEERVSDIEKLTAFNAMLGARPAIFDGTFDYLKERQAGDTTVFNQSHYKLAGKVDPATPSHYHLDRPRG